MIRVFRRTIRALIVTSSILMAAPGAAAQSVSGSISGTVVDQSRQVVPGATVTLIDEQTGAPSVTVATNDTGAFVFSVRAAGPLHRADRAGRLRQRRAQGTSRCRRTSSCRSGPSCWRSAR